MLAALACLETPVVGDTSLSDRGGTYRLPAKNEDLHGMVPDKSAVALLLLDVINALEFEEGGLLLEHMLPMAERLAALKRRARASGIPAIYVNDNYGRWQSDFNR